MYQQMLLGVTVYAAAGMDRPMSPLSGGNSLFRGDSLSSGSGSWSITSSELEDVSSTPGSGRRHRSGSGSNLLSPDRWGFCASYVGGPFVPTMWVGLTCLPRRRALPKPPMSQSFVPQRRYVFCTARCHLHR